MFLWDFHLTRGGRSFEALAFSPTNSPAQTGLCSARRRAGGLPVSSYPLFVVSLRLSLTAGVILCQQIFGEDFATHASIFLSLVFGVLALSW
jgi:hypothetical protein